MDNMDEAYPLVMQRQGHMVPPSSSPLTLGSTGCSWRGGSVTVRAAPTFPHKAGSPRVAPPRPLASMNRSIQGRNGAEPRAAAAWESLVPPRRLRWLLRPCTPEWPCSPPARGGP